MKDARRMKDVKTLSYLTVFTITHVRCAAAAARPNARRWLV